MNTEEEIMIFFNEKGKAVHPINKNGIVNREL